MHFPHKLFALLLMFTALQAHADNPDTEDVTRTLPALPGEQAIAPGKLELVGKSLSVNYGDLQQQWRASIDEYKSGNAMFSVDYGLRLNDVSAAGGRVSQQQDHSEVLVNGIYALGSDLRLNGSAGQLRPNSDYVSESAANGYSGITQNSYLLGAKKYWSKDSLISDFGISSYLVEASGRTAGTTATSVRHDSGDTDSMYLDTPTLGKKTSFVVNLGLHPTADSRIEWRRERGRLQYYGIDDGKDRENLMSSRFKYSHNIDSCTQFQGRYRSSDNFDKLNVGIERNNWNVSVTRTRDGAVDTGIQFGYKIPLVGSLSSAGNCKQKTDAAPSFKPLLDTSTRRPDLFPRDPLLK